MFFLHKIKDSVDVPVVANGDIKNEDDVAKVKQMTGVDGEWNILWHNVLTSLEKTLTLFLFEML